MSLKRQQNKKNHSSRSLIRKIYFQTVQKEKVNGAKSLFVQGYMQIPKEIRSLPKSQGLHVSQSLNKCLYIFAEGQATLKRGTGREKRRNTFWWCHSQACAVKERKMKEKTLKSLGEDTSTSFSTRPISKKGSKMLACKKTREKEQRIT